MGVRTFSCNNLALTALCVAALSGSHWQVVISVTGGAQDFDLTAEQKDKLMHGSASRRDLLSFSLLLSRVYEPQIRARRKALNT